MLGHLKDRLRTEEKLWMVTPGDSHEGRVWSTLIWIYRSSCYYLCTAPGLLQACLKAKTRKPPLPGIAQLLAADGCWVGRAWPGATWWSTTNKCPGGRSEKGGGGGGAAHTRTTDKLKFRTLTLRLLCCTLSLYTGRDQVTAAAGRSTQWCCCRRLRAAAPSPRPPLPPPPHLPL